MILSPQKERNLKYHRAAHIGSHHGRLTINHIFVDPSPTAKGRYFAECRCECGLLTLHQLKYILNGEATSCGCRRKELAAKRAYDRTNNMYTPEAQAKRVETLRRNMR